MEMGRRREKVAERFREKENETRRELGVKDDKEKMNE